MMNPKSSIEAAKKIRPILIAKERSLSESLYELRSLIDDLESASDQLAQATDDAEAALEWLQSVVSDASSTWCTTVDMDIIFDSLKKAQNPNLGAPKNDDEDDENTFWYGHPEDPDRH
jgi:hypothetical protein